MNPSSSSSYWDNPPPPGTEFDSPEEDSNISGHKNESPRSSDRAIDRIDPFLKNPLYHGREEDYSSDRTRYRSRSNSPERYKRRRRQRSRSRDRYKRSHSGSHRRRRRYSVSRSRSRSRSPSYRHRRKRHNRRYSRSRSKSRSGSFSVSRSRRSDRDKKHSRSPRVKQELKNSEKSFEEDIIKEEDMKLEDPEEDESPEPEQAPVLFKNDGSFLEMFKKMQEQKVKEEPSDTAELKKPILPAFGKRRGGKVLKTGMVQKIRNFEDDSSKGQDAWSVYMEEVRKYKEACCNDDSKTRPLLK